MATKPLFRTRICQTWDRSETMPILRLCTSLQRLERSRKNEFFTRSVREGPDIKILTPDEKGKITPFRGNDQSIYLFFL